MVICESQHDMWSLQGSTQMNVLCPPRGSSHTLAMPSVFSYFTSVSSSFATMNDRFQFAGSLDTSPWTCAYEDGDPVADAKDDWCCCTLLLLAVSWRESTSSRLFACSPIDFLTCYPQVRECMVMCPTYVTSNGTIHQSANFVLGNNLFRSSFHTVHCVCRNWIIFSWPSKSSHRPLFLTGASFLGDQFLLAS